jgi:hypothetical protein
MTLKAAPSAFIALFLACVALPAPAEMGPCKQDETLDAMFCGSGNGAAFVIRDTLSPSGRLALAWRTPDGPPTEQPDEDKIELVVVRIADGAILSRGKTDYWDTGESHVNRLEELAYWSPDSRMMVRTFHSRFSTDNVEIYAFGADDAVSGPFDLRKILEPAARAQMKSRVKNPGDYEFFMSGMREEEKPVSIDNRGLIRANVMLWVPKTGPMYYFAANVRTTRGKGSLDARVLSVIYRGMEKE